MLMATAESSVVVLAAMALSAWDVPQDHGAITARHLKGIVAKGGFSYPPSCIAANTSFHKTFRFAT